MNTLDTLMQAEIFFFISSIGFVVLAILTIIFLVYLIQFMASASRVMESIEEDVENISDSTKEVIADIEESWIFKLLFHKKRSRKKK